MKRRGAAKSRIDYDKPNDDKVIISSEYFTNDRPSYICSICNQTLSRLSDAGGNNSTYWCKNCSVEFNPELGISEENPRYQYPIGTKRHWLQQRQELQIYQFVRNPS
jgi:DNA-directed RNA polymerase subunit RPC12/RpoP